VERVVVLGSSGSGKTMLAEALARRTGLPIVYLDLLFWRPGWKRAPEDEAVGALEARLAEDRWIVEGDFLGAGDTRFERADTVVFLDFPRHTCIRRVLWRLVRDRRRSRPDLPEGCREEIDLDLLRWVWRYRRNTRPRVLEILQRLNPHVRVRRLRSPADVRRFLDEC
jgi:adenylate kinase family enzyme